MNPDTYKTYNQKDNYHQPFAAATRECEIHTENGKKNEKKSLTGFCLTFIETLNLFECLLHLLQIVLHNSVVLYYFFFVKYLVNLHSNL